MKKFKITVCLVILFILTACSNSNDLSDLNKIENHIQLDVLKVGRPIVTRASRSGILYFENKTMIFYEDADPNDDKDINLYKCDIETGQTTFITKIKNFAMSFESIAVSNDILYYPFTSIKGGDSYQSNILEINLNDLSINLVEVNTTNIPTVQLKTVQDGYLMINRNSIDDVSTVYIDFVGISGKAETILESREIPSSLGICVQDESIYCYMSSLNKDEKAEESFIREYSLKGEFKNEYPFNIDDFLKLEEVEDTDSVFKIVKANDYYVFKTDNNRNCILKQKRNKLEIAKIPEPLSSFGDGGVMILDHYSRYSDYVYFRQLTSNEIYIFDSQKSSFSLISFIDENDEISGITRDSTGNIIVEVQSGEHEYNYYYVSVSELIK